MALEYNGDRPVWPEKCAREITLSRSYLPEQPPNKTSVLYTPPSTIKASRGCQPCARGYEFMYNSTYNRAYNSNHENHADHCPSAPGLNKPCGTAKQQRAIASSGSGYAKNKKPAACYAYGQHVHQFGLPPEQMYQTSYSSQYQPKLNGPQYSDTQMPNVYTNVVQRQEPQSSFLRWHVDKPPHLYDPSNIPTTNNDENTAPPWTTNYNDEYRRHTIGDPAAVPFRPVELVDDQTPYTVEGQTRPYFAPFDMWQRVPENEDAHLKPSETHDRFRKPETTRDALASIAVPTMVADMPATVTHTGYQAANAIKPVDEPTDYTTTYRDVHKKLPVTINPLKPPSMQNIPVPHHSGYLSNIPSSTIFGKEPFNGETIYQTDFIDINSTHPKRIPPDADIRPGYDSSFTSQQESSEMWKIIREPGKCGDPLGSADKINYMHPTQQLARKLDDRYLDLKDRKKDWNI